MLPDLHVDILSTLQFFGGVWVLLFFVFVLFCLLKGPQVLPVNCFSVPGFVTYCPFTAQHNKISASMLKIPPTPGPDFMTKKLLSM